MLSHFSIAYLFSVLSACAPYPESLQLGVSTSLTGYLPCLRPGLVLKRFPSNENGVRDKLENLMGSSNSWSQPNCASNLMFLCPLHWWGDSTLLEYCLKCMCLTSSFPFFLSPKDVLIAQEEIAIKFFITAHGKLPVPLTASPISGHPLSWETGHYQPFLLIQKS